MASPLPGAPQVPAPALGPYDPRVYGADCDNCPLKGRASPVPPEWGHLRRSVGIPTSPFPLVLVGDSPGQHDAKEKRPFIGPAGVTLNEALFSSGVKRENTLLLTYAILCRPEVPDQKGRKRYDLRGYMAWLRKENVKRRAANKLLKKTGGVPVPERKSPFACCAPRLSAELAFAERIIAETSAGAPHLAPLNMVIMPMGGWALSSVQGNPGHPASIFKWRGSVLTDPTSPPQSHP